MLEKAIRLWNPWWIYGTVDESKKGIRRDLTNDIIGSLKIPHIKDIVGVRRCGKTTVLYQIIAHLLKQGIRPKDILFLNFDDIQISGSDFDEVLKNAERIDPNIRYLFLDEVQVKEGWERWVRTLYDTKMYEQIFITGSSSSVLSTDIGRVLTGRHITFRLLPFSFSEFLKFNGWTDLSEENILANENKVGHFLDRYLVEGGFPEVIGKNEYDRKIILTNLFNDILVRDVISRFGGRKDMISNLAFYLLSNVCSEYSLRRISNALEISVETVGKYIDHLIEAELFHPLNIFSYKLKQQFKRNKKIYCVDTGLVDTAGHGHRDKARLMENLVLLEFLRRKEDVYYWKSKRQQEVDFVVKGKQLEFYQVCLDLTDERTKKREFDSLVAALDYYNVSKGEMITIDVIASDSYKAKRIDTLPLVRFLLGLKRGG